MTSDLNRGGTAQAVPEGDIKGVAAPWGISSVSGP